VARKRRTQRLRRVDETLRQVIADSLLVHDDPLVASVVVTGVETSSDTAYADVFVQVPGAEARRPKALAAIERARPGIQARINAEMHLRATPVLRFQHDDSLEHALRIDRLLAEHAPGDDA
jgi:ribosome-binding factor A